MQPSGMMTYLRQFEGLQQIVLHLDRTGDNTQDLEVAVASNHFVEQLNSHYKWVPLWIELAGNLPDLELITLKFPKITKLPKGGVSLGVGGGLWDLKFDENHLTFAPRDLDRFIESTDEYY